MKWVRGSKTAYMIAGQVQANVFPHNPEVVPYGSLFSIPQFFYEAMNSRASAVILPSLTSSSKKKKNAMYLDVKRPLVPPAYTRQTRQFRWKMLVWPLTFLVFLYTLMPHFQVRLRPGSCHETARVTYEGESISWEPCGEITGHPLECSNLTVPMNHFTAANSSDANDNKEVFSIPLIRMRANNATQNLIINPGGPGASGVGFVYAIGDELNTILDEGYHILSFDPRRVNGSRPKAECYPDEPTRRAHSMPRSGRFSDTGAMYAWNKNFARACYDNMGEHAKYSG